MHKKEGETPWLHPFLVNTIQQPVFDHLKGLLSCIAETTGHNQQLCKLITLSSVVKGLHKGFFLKHV